jgi:hypothetical protein
MSSRIFADEVSAANLLQDVAGRPRHDRVEQGLIVAEGREHQADDLGHPGSNLPAHAHPVTVWQPNVEDCHVGLERRDAGQRRRRGTRLTDDLDVRRGFQQILHAPADHFMIIEQEYLQRQTFTVVDRRRETQGPWS